MSCGMLAELSIQPINDHSFDVARSGFEVRKFCRLARAFDQMRNVTEFSLAQHIYFLSNEISDVNSSKMVKPHFP